MSESTKHFSELQELKIAEYLGWKRVSGSGARPNHPGDVISDAWLGECKTHVAKVDKLYFNFEVFDKISNEATSQFKDAVLFTDDGTQDINKTWCMVQLFDYDSAGAIDEECENSSISLNIALVEKLKIPWIIKHDNKTLCIMHIQDFKQFIELD